MVTQPTLNKAAHTGVGENRCQFVFFQSARPARAALQRSLAANGRVGSIATDRCGPKSLYVGCSPKATQSQNLPRPKDGGARLSLGANRRGRMAPGSRWCVLLPLRDPPRLGVQKDATGFSKFTGGGPERRGAAAAEDYSDQLAVRHLVLRVLLAHALLLASIVANVGARGKTDRVKVIAYGFKQDSHFVLAKAPLISHSRAGLRTENAVREPPGSLPFGTVDRHIGRAFALPVSGSQSRRTILARLNPKQIEEAAVIRSSIALFQFRNSGLQCAHRYQLSLSAKSSSRLILWARSAASATRTKLSMILLNSAASDGVNFPAATASKTEAAAPNASADDCTLASAKGTARSRRGAINRSMTSRMAVPSPALAIPEF